MNKSVFCGGHAVPDGQVLLLQLGQSLVLLVGRESTVPTLALNQGGEVLLWVDIPVRLLGEGGGGALVGVEGWMDDR